jgi:WhiB family redox-sensing transcriptional regulator
MTGEQDRAVSRLAVLVGREGRCAGSVAPDAWFPPDSGPTEPARARAVALARVVCAGCPVTTACLALAVATGEEHGIWGATAAHERAALLRTNKEATTEQLALWPTGDVA